MGVGDIAYEGTATFGRIHSVIGTIIITVVALLFIAIGLYLLIKKPVVHYTSEDDGSPEQKVMSKTSENVLGVGLILGALIIAGLSWLMTYFTMKSKSFAAVAGTADIASDLMNVFGNH